MGVSSPLEDMPGQRGQGVNRGASQGQNLFSMATSELQLVEETEREDMTTQDVQHGPVEAIGVRAFKMLDMMHKMMEGDVPVGVGATITTVRFFSNLSSQCKREHATIITRLVMCTDSHVRLVVLTVRDH